jgi:hypothetical protein
MKTSEKQQRKFTKLNQKEFLEEFQFWLEENERRINIFTNYYEIPAKNSDGL